VAQARGRGLLQPGMRSCRRIMQHPFLSVDLPECGHQPLCEACGCCSRVDADSRCSS
jgi:hypothetical protein